MLSLKSRRVRTQPVEVEEYLLGLGSRKVPELREGQACVLPGWCEVQDILCDRTGE
jgi:hypothetical protein